MGVSGVRKVVWSDDKRDCGGDLGDLGGDMEGDRDDCLAADSVPLLHCKIEPFLTFLRQD